MKNGYSTKRSPSTNQDIETECFFAPEDDNHEDDGMDDVNSSSSRSNFDIESGASLSARKDEFYHQVDKKIHALEKDHKTVHIKTDDLFNDAFQFLMAIKKGPRSKLTKYHEEVSQQVALQMDKEV